MPVDARHYHTRIARMILYPFGSVAIVLSLLVALQPRGGILIHLYTAALLIGSIWLFVRITHQGVETTPATLIIRNALKTSTVGWSDIRAFDTRKWFVNHEVMVVLTNGQRIHTALVQQRVVVWKGGQTKDILSVLQNELDLRSGLHS